MRYEDKRKIMVETQLIDRGITDERLLAAFLKVEREEFVADDLKSFSYSDHPLTIGEGQTISQPYMVACMLEILKITKDHSVLEIGTGSGYQTALLAELAMEVFSVERVDKLAFQAQNILRKLKYKNIFFKIGDGTLGWEKGSPSKSFFDRIIVSAASPTIPETLVRQLADNGMMAIPVGNRISQDLILVEKKNDFITKKNMGGCVFVPLIGKEGWSK